LRRRLILPLVIAAAATAWLLHTPVDSPSDTASTEPARIAADGAPVLCCVHDRLQRGESMYDLLMRSGITPRTALEVGAALAHVINPGRLQARDQFELLFDPREELAAVTVQRSPLERYQLVSDGSSFTARRIDVAVDTLYRTVWGQLDDNLWSAFVDAGAPPSVIVSFTEVFAWSVDFFRDVRRGDAFGVRFAELRVDDRVVGTTDIEAAFYVRGPDTLWAFSFLEGGHLRYYDFEGRSLRKALLRAPLRFSRVSSGFSRRRFHPVHNRYQPHYGVDYAAAPGTPVYAAGDGRVHFAGRKRGLGNCIELRHPNGFRTVYGHLQRIARGISTGAAVEQKQLIGYVGSTGNATGPHLHYEVWQGRSAVNPRTLKLPARGPVPEARRVAYVQHRNRLHGLVVPPYGPMLAGA